MKTLTRILLTLTMFGLKVQAQQAISYKREYLLDNPLFLKLFGEYRTLAEQKGYFVNGKGVYKLVRHKENDNKIRWNLNIVIDDEYKENLPESYAMYGHDVILIYNADSPGISFSWNKLRSLEYIIKDRVYIRPPFQEIYWEYDGKEGRPFGKDSSGNFLRRPITHHYDARGVPNGLIVLFDKEMTKYTIYPEYR